MSDITILIHRDLSVDESIVLEDFISRMSHLSVSLLIKGDESRRGHTGEAESPPADIRKDVP